jgi:hypothetical protein
MILSTQVKRGIGRQQVAGFLDPPFAGKHLSRQDESLCPRAAFCQAAIHQKLIGTPPPGHGSLQHGANGQKFFGSFFQKRTRFLTLAPPH